MECPISKTPFLSRLGCTLNYAGSTSDVILNYAVLLLNLWYLSLYTQTLRSRRYASASLAFVFLFQIGLCLILGCTGISIVWCACGGWILYYRFKGLSSREALTTERLVLAIDGLTILYYTTTGEGAAITTLAHACAILLGVLLCYMEECSVNSPATVLFRSSTPLVTHVEEEDEHFDNEKNNK